MKKILIILLCKPLISFSDQLMVIPVGEAKVLKEKVIIQSETFGKLSPLEKRQSLVIQKTILNNFNFYSHLIEIEKIENRNITLGEKNKFLSKYQRGNYLLKIKFIKENNSYKFVAEGRNILKNEKKLEYERIISQDHLRLISNEVSEKFFKEVLKKDSIFKDKILFISDYASKKGYKNIYIMDFDGYNIKKITSHQGIVISLSVSKDGKKVLYSLINEKKIKKKNVNLILLDLETKKSTLISKRKGLNSGAIFSNGGKNIILTMSHQGNSEIYEIDISSKYLTRLTKNRGIDVDPSLSDDGNLMTFLSTRSGKAMIYTMNLMSPAKEIKRISYVGKFNATPRFSPDSKEIVFSSWLDNRFDLFKINNDGLNLSRLTKDFGSNEDPDYSKDGQFIVFTSQKVISSKKSSKNVYIMDIEGRIIRPLALKFGKCTGPRWIKSL